MGRVWVCVLLCCIQIPYCRGVALSRSCSAGVRVVIWARFVIKEEHSIRESSVPYDFSSSHALSSLLLCAEMLTGGSVGAGWDQ